MDEQFIRYDASEGIATITLDRPAKRNALTRQMCADIAAAWRRMAADDSVRVAIITSSSDVAFTAGADLTDPPTNFPYALPEIGIQLNKPVIAAVAGHVVGAGFTLVMQCDLCVAAENTRFVYPEAKIGAALGLVAGLSARIPYKIAMEAMLIGDPLTAQRAYEVGFINRVVPVGQQLATAREMAATLAGNAPLVMAMLKQFTRETMPTSPVERQYRTRAAMDVVGNSADMQEGLAAFRDKRKPKFSGK
jgi:enoyl-CoA hydratase/carnithine racemase